ncbi:hypothetical protein [Streptomyces sp. NPDC059072]|uniref:hypothetical protein n=1 Tax=Streptomyces sp. NPDC059072 TaxID=3346715 RepID=UPI00368DB21E
MAERQRQGLGGASGNGFAGLVRLRTDSDAGLRALVECCASRRPTPYKADDYALLTHEAYRTTLRALRRDPAASPRTRRGAMAALVAGGGADGLDARDLAAIERLIRVQIADETPSAPSPQLSGWWLAVPGASYEGLFGALDLHHRRPITCATGVEASGREIRVPVPGGDGAVETVGHVFVTHPNGTATRSPGRPTRSTTPISTRSTTKPRPTREPPARAPPAATSRSTQPWSAQAPKPADTAGSPSPPHTPATAPSPASSLI